KRCNGILFPDTVLPFDDEELAGVTVADVLANPSAFEGETLADPVEGVECGRCKAMIMRRYDGTSWIHSFAHGRTVYELRYDATALKTAIAESEAQDAVRVLIKLLLQADVSEPEEETLISLAVMRTGGKPSRVARELKKARKEKSEKDRSEKR